MTGNSSLDIKCNLSFKDLNFQPWVFTSPGYGISFADVVALYNKGLKCCDRPVEECDCGTPMTRAEVAALAMSQKRVEAKLTNAQGVEVTGDQVTKSIGFLVGKVKELEESLARTQKELEVLKQDKV